MVLLSLTRSSFLRWWSMSPWSRGSCNSRAMATQATPRIISKIRASVGGLIFIVTLTMMMMMMIMKKKKKRAWNWAIIIVYWSKEGDSIWRGVVGFLVNFYLEKVDGSFLLLTRIMGVLSCLFVSLHHWSCNLMYRPPLSCLFIGKQSQLPTHYTLILGHLVGRNGLGREYQSPNKSLGIQVYPYKNNSLYKVELRPRVKLGRALAGAARTEQVNTSLTPWLSCYNIHICFFIKK